MALPASARRSRLHVPASSSGGRRPRLTVVDARSLPERQQRRRARAMAAFAALVVVGALLFVVIGQTIVASQQVRLDNLRQQLSAATAANENLELAQAELSSPPQVLDIAQHHLGMVAPGGVIYLVPAKQGPTVAEAAAGRR